MLAHLCPADKEDEAGHGSDTIQPGNVCKIIKIVPDVVLQEPRTRLLPVSLQSYKSFSRLHCHTLQQYFTTANGAYYVQVLLHSTAARLSERRGGSHLGTWRRSA